LKKLPVLQALPSSKVRAVGFFLEKRRFLGTQFFENTDTEWLCKIAVADGPWASLNRPELQF